MKPIKIKSILFALGCMCTLSGHAQLTSTYASQSVLNTGRWVKIAVKTSGIQQITADQLRAWGFDNPSAVKVYGYGGTALCSSQYKNMPEDLAPTPTVLTGDGRILFYGAADVTARPKWSTQSYLYDIEINRNTYSLAGYYFLTDGDVSSEAGRKLPYAASSTVQNTHLALTYIDEEVQNPAAGGAVFMGHDYAAGEPMPFEVNVRNFANESRYGSKMAYYASFYAKLNSSATYSYTLEIPEAFYASTSQRPSVSSSSNNAIRAYKGRTYALLTPTDGIIPDGKYEFTITSPANANINATAYDYAYLTYPRYNVMSDDEHQLDMFVGSASAGENLAVSNARSDTHVWNVTDPADIAIYDISFDEETQTAKIALDESLGTWCKPACLVAFNDGDTHLPVEFAGNVANQNLHALDVPNLLIITTNELYDKACELADIHRQHQGLDVVVVTQEQVFNEFSSGTPAAHAYRRLAKMFYDRNMSKMQNLLLYGGGSWDNRSIVTSKPQERLLTYQAEFNTPKTVAAGADMSSYIFDANISFASDAWMGMLSDDFATETLLSTVNTMQIGVGRLAVLDVNDADMANAKVLDILQNPMSTLARQNAIFISDVKNKELHIAQGEEAANQLVSFNENTTANRLHVFLYPRDAKAYRQMLADKFATGVSYFSYAGHGGNSSLGAAFPIWTNDEINANEYTAYPYGMLSTCDTYAFDRSDKNFATNLVLKQHGGMSAVVGAGRTVIMERNQVLNKAMTEIYAIATGRVTAGELFRRGMNRALTNSLSVNTTQCRANTLSYNLSGDPAIPYDFPVYKVEVTTPSVSGTIDVDPMSTFTIEGKITSYAGTFQSGYNGTATITIYEAPHEMALQPIVSSENITNYPSSITVDEMPLVSVNVPVKAGLFKADIVMPYATYLGDKNRVLITAINQNNLVAAGTWSKIRLTDTPADTPADAHAPQITELYLNNDGFTEGDVTDTNVKVLATIVPGTAPLYAASYIGAGVHLQLDDATTYTKASHAVRYNSDGSGNFAFDLKNLTPGRHKLTLSVNDIAGNTVQRSIEFMVGNTAGALLTADVTTAREAVTLDLAHDMADSAETSLVIEDSKGNPVVRIDNASWPYVWNLSTSSGRVADGFYRAYVRLKNGTATTATPAVTFAVIK